MLVNKTSEQLSVKVNPCDSYEFVKKFEPNPFFSGTVCYGEVRYTCSFVKLLLIQLK